MTNSIPKANPWQRYSPGVWFNTKTGNKVNSVTAPSWPPKNKKTNQTTPPTTSANPSFTPPNWIDTSLVGKTYDQWIGGNTAYKADKDTLNKQMAQRMAARGLLGSGAEEASTNQANIELNKQYQNQFDTQKQQTTQNLADYLQQMLGWNQSQTSTAANLLSNLTSTAATQQPGSVPSAILQGMGLFGGGGGGGSAPSGPNYNQSSQAGLGFKMNQLTDWLNNLFKGLGSFNVPTAGTKITGS
jgi:hypothetical protein